MEIRRYEPRDLDELARLFNDYRVFYEQPSDLRLAKRFIAERTQADDSVIFVADAGDSMLAGFCQLYPSLCSVAAAPIYVLYDLFVSPVSRRAGVARQLLQASASRAKSDGKVRMDLTTARDNLKAQALYESLGWTRDDLFYTYNLAVN
ncbi:ribosomal protein S18 acetylase RimI-like enzyme [Paraburkholderia terricola]|uniref:GNAT family N-acetyltransferase n=1 Tax=Paraburkholderia terricola TaxID=169427 RepID=UPI00285C6D17|nr:GNAT family N-acetyltransferase [Paraburkholderia terricola]MDR6450163.1 ribosomal protein S18 acetylase RimI-like enzyme [Paraburkholderia terricola]